MAQSHAIHDEGKLRVAIAGGGIAGLVTAYALLRHPGVSVQVYERAQEFKEIGASIGLGPNGLRTLEKLGLDDVISGDVCSRQKGDWPMIYRHWKTGEVIDHDVHYTVRTHKHFTARYHRAHLHQALQEHVPRNIIHLGKKTVNVEVGQEGVVLHFEDGTTAEADICVGADGIHSAIRKTFVPDHKLRWTGWVALRSTFDASLLDGVEFPEDAAHWIGHERTFFHSHLGKGQFTIVGSFHADPSSVNEPYSNVKWNDVGDVSLLRDYYKHWNPAVKAMVEATPNTRLFPNMSGEALKTWNFGNRVTLVGDAAHTHGGAFAAGGSLAIDDAYALSLALNHVWPASAANGTKPSPQDISRILRVYETTRKPHIDRVLDAVKHQVVGRRGSNEETDEDLIERVKKRMDPAWISEHDVEASFLAAVDETKVTTRRTVSRAAAGDVSGFQPPKASL